MTRQLIPYKSKLDQGTAYWMARLSKVVYFKTSPKNDLPHEEKILKNLQAEDPGFISVKGYNNNSAQGALIEHKDYLCMVFRGTDEAADWLDNINAFSTDELFGKFHRGFWNSLADIWEPIYQDYCRLKAANKRPLFFTGHSLGGAMASIAAARFIQQDWPFTAAYTFGQPRAMAREAARIFNAEAAQRYHRFQNNNDLVTRIPSRLMGYSHVGSYLYISEEKTIHADPGFWFRFLDSIDGAVESVMESGIDAIEDHSMDRYLAAVKRWDFET
ncbi:MAG: lipase family protein [Motiliproteus sp.]